MIIPPIGATPLPVAPAVSVPIAIQPVQPAPRSGNGGERQRSDDGRHHPTLYGRSGAAPASQKGRFVDREA